MHRFNPFPPDEGGVAERPRPSSIQESAHLTPAELSDWLDAHRQGIAERWIVEVRSRAGDVDEAVLPLLEEFLHLLASFLAPGMGAFRDQAEVLLQEAAELYGNLGGHRGQAAGEAVEEFQLLREVLLRFLYLDSPAGGIESVGLREFLQLNRLVDVGVTYASIGHTDTLFFNLFQGTGVTGAPTPEFLGTVRDQVGAIRDELDRLLDHQAKEEAARAG